MFDNNMGKKTHEVLPKGKLDLNQLDSSDSNRGGGPSAQAAVANLPASHPLPKGRFFQFGQCENIEEGEEEKVQQEGEEFGDEEEEEDMFGEENKSDYNARR